MNKETTTTQLIDLALIMMKTRIRYITGLFIRINEFSYDARQKRPH